MRKIKFNFSFYVSAFTIVMCLLLTVFFCYPFKDTSQTIFTIRFFSIALYWKYYVAIVPIIVYLCYLFRKSNEFISYAFSLINNIIVFNVPWAFIYLHYGYLRKNFTQFLLFDIFISIVFAIVFILKYSIKKHSRMEN